MSTVQSRSSERLRIETVKVPEHQAGRRIDVVLNEEIVDLSRERVKALVKDSKVTLNGIIVVKPSTPVKAGDKIELRMPPPVSSQVEAEPLPLEILYEDDHLAVVNKPPGWVVHPAGPLRTGTLVNALLHHFGTLSTIGGVTRPGIVHRLDKETSGLLIVAKNDFAHQSLSNQFQSREVQKTYWALVHGVPKEREGGIDLPIGRHPKDRKRFAVCADGRPAVTRWRLLGSSGEVSWLEVRILTGRTHQIRVHLRHIGYPVLKDRLYGFRNTRLRGGWAQRLRDYPGMLLHAYRVGFTHPASGVMMTFEVNPPRRFQEAIEEIKGPEIYVGNDTTSIA